MDENCKVYNSSGSDSSKQFRFLNDYICNSFSMILLVILDAKKKKFVYLLVMNYQWPIFLQHLLILVLVLISTFTNILTLVNNKLILLTNINIEINAVKTYCS